MVIRAALDHIVLTSRDVERSLTFYIDVLGFEPYRVDAWRRGEIPFPSVRLGPESIIDLLPPEFWNGDDAADGGKNLHHFCVAIDAGDWSGVEKRLAEAGVATTGPMTLHGARGDATAFYLTDPDDNQLEIRTYD